MEESHDGNVAPVSKQYCEFSPNPQRCRLWLDENDPDLYQTVYGVEGVTEKLRDANVAEAQEGDATEGDKKHQTRGGKALLRDDSKKLAKEEAKRKKARVIISVEQRNKRKSVTHIRGLDAFGLDLKQVAKRCASKFACGCSVVAHPAGYEEVVIQGDFIDDLLDFFPDEWPEVPEDQIEIKEK